MVTLFVDGPPTCQFEIGLKFYEDASLFIISALIPILLYYYFDVKLSLVKI